MKTVLEKEISILSPSLESILPKDTLKNLANSPIDNLWAFHFGLGLYLRNNILNSDSKLYTLFLESGILCKDDMSSMILKLYHEYLITKSVTL